MNKLYIIGNTTKDAELRSTQDGTSVCSFTVAVNRKSKKKNENGSDVDYFRVTAWRKLAEVCGQYVKKGSKLAVVGPVSVSTYTTNDGQTRASLEVTADDVEFLSSKSDSNAQKESYNQAPEVPEAPEVPQQSSGYTDVSADFDSSELPF